MSKPPKELIARTGRVQSWIDDPTSRLPVSCTVFVVEDTMEGENGIEASWRFVSHALRYGAGVAVHLSKLRPKGAENGKGLVASGPVSFAKIYSTLNEILRRGGVYKNGAVVCHLDLSHPDVLEFITASRSELPWVKRCVNVNDHWWEESSQEVKVALLEGIKKGDIWLNKTKVDRNGNRIRGNVCLEVYLPSRGTCLLQHVNLGGCELDEIRGAFAQGMSELCSLHGKTNVGESGEYLPSETDRQVGLGMLGLANLLRVQGVTYNDFGLALEALNSGRPYPATPGYVIAKELQAGIQAAAEIAKANRMERAFAIAPTASCSYRYTDLDGYTTTPEIAPPIARQVDRDSGTFGVQSFDYGPVEVASEVGWEAYKRVVDGIVRLLDSTGLLHGYSFNSWSDVVTYDEQFIEDWLASPQTSLYYSLQVMGDVQDKSNVYAALSQSDIDDYLDELFKDDPAPDCNCGE
jgi:hypothetical protein